MEKCKIITISAATHKQNRAYMFTSFKAQRAFCLKSNGTTKYGELHPFSKMSKAPLPSYKSKQYRQIRFIVVYSIVVIIIQAYKEIPHFPKEDSSLHKYSVTPLLLLFHEMRISISGGNCAQQAFSFYSWHHVYDLLDVQGNHLELLHLC